MLLLLDNIKIMQYYDGIEIILSLFSDCYICLLLKGFLVEIVFNLRLD